MCREQNSNVIDSVLHLFMKGDGFFFHAILAIKGIVETGITGKSRQDKSVREEKTQRQLGKAAAQVLGPSFFQVLWTTRRSDTHNF